MGGRLACLAIHAQAKPLSGSNVFPLPLSSCALCHSISLWLSSRYSSSAVICKQPPADKARPLTPHRRQGCSHRRQQIIIIKQKRIIFSFHKLSAFVLAEAKSVLFRRRPPLRPLAPHSPANSLLFADNLYSKAIVFFPLFVYVCDLPLPSQLRSRVVFLTALLAFVRPH